LIATLQNFKGTDRMNGHDKTTFWNKKILQWEQARYRRQARGQTVLERLVRGGGGSIRNRLVTAGNLLRPHIRGRTLLDVGCGSGLLFQQLSGCGASRFIGVDLAQSAISNAQQLARRLPEPTTFLVGNATQMELPRFDVIVGLGILDWLSGRELDSLFGKISGNRFLFSISETRVSVAQLLHRLYVYVSYGWKNSSYVPRYESVKKILSLLARHGFEQVDVFRHKSLSFGVLLHNLRAP
jgi:2-polyprenyl-3-methyl-5-hydroxy-6-metoxy-1,4-benzoquinol methylase